MSPVIFWKALSRVSLKNTPGVGGYYEPSKKKIGFKVWIENTFKYICGVLLDQGLGWWFPEGLCEPCLGWVSFGSKEFGSKIFLSIFSRNLITFKKIFVFYFFFDRLSSPPGAPPSNFRKSYPDPELTNNCGPLSPTFHVEQPEMLIEWKCETMTYGPTYGLTWVGARDACAS